MGKRTATIAASAGNFLETYNFTIYAFFGPMIAATFFPTANHLTSLLYALLAFGLGFVARPIGAIAMGVYEKAHGRRATLQLVFILMGIGTAILAATPSYHSIGILAPISVLVARLVQGFSEGGEIGPATTMLLDLAPPGRGAHFVALQPITQILAALLAVIGGALVSALLPHAALYAWGWRLPYLVGLIIIPLGLMLRRTIADAPAIHGAVHRQPEAASTGLPWRAILLALVLMASGTISSYANLFGVSYAISVLHLPPLTAMISMATGLLASLGAMPFGLWLARFISPRSMVMFTSTVCLVLIYPAYHFAISHPGTMSLVLLNLLTSGFSALPAAFVMLTLLQALPERQRSMQFGLVCAVAISFFGGSTQPVLTWLIRDTGSAYVPCWALMAMTAIALWAVLKLGISGEKQPRKLQPLGPLAVDATS